MITTTLMALLPELLVAFTATLILLVDLFKENTHRFSKLAAVAGLGCAAIASLLGSQGPLGSLHRVAKDVLSVDPLACFFKTLICALAILVVVISFRSFEQETRHSGEYYSMLLFSVLGMLLVTAATEFLTFFVAFELLSLPLYMLVGFRRYHRDSAEAGLKYFLTGAASSAVLLFGFSWLYGATGTTRFIELVARLEPSTLNPFLVGLIMVLVAVGFKISAAPFHMWAPDVYQGGPTPVVAFLSTAPKAAMLCFALRLFAGELHGLGARFGTDGLYLFSALAVLSVVVGNLVALPQKDIRRVLAYSGVAQIGYLLTGLLAAAGGGDNDLAAGSVLYYTLIYTVTNLGVWTAVLVIQKELGSCQLSDWAGLSTRNPFLALVLFVGLLSLAGAPPFAGFVGKVYLFRSAFAAQPLAVLIGVVGSVISLFYYARVMKAMYLEKAPDDAKPVRGVNSASVLATVMAVPTLLFGLFWQPLAIMANWSARFFH